MLNSSRFATSLFIVLGLATPLAHAGDQKAPIIQMVTVPTGTVTMGCEEARDSACFDSEKPAHTVNIAAFELSKTEVTQAQWKAVMGNNPSIFKTCGNACPVENVSWEDAQKFIQALNAQTGKSYRLPTEAEWEYACRAGTNGMYCGTGKVKQLAWHDQNSRERTHRVGTKHANAFGLHDMSGNVWEWVQDSWHDNYQSAPNDGKVWQVESELRVLRGGSWYDQPQDVRAAGRINPPATFRDYDVGFRLARSLP